jgi:hypothetical protein
MAEDLKTIEINDLEACIELSLSSYHSNSLDMHTSLIV